MFVKNYISRTRLKLLAVVLVLLLLLPNISVSACIFTKPPSFQTTDSGDNYQIEYEWNFKWRRWVYKTEIPKSAYNYYSTRKRVNNYAEYVLNPDDDEWVKHIADSFVEKINENKWDSFDSIAFVLTFIQSMPYTSDLVTTGFDEYPRYPVETIVDGGGDCEDTSILFASIIREMDYGVALLLLEEDSHMAVGIKISQTTVDNWHQSYPLTYYTHTDGTIYAYCETTGDGYGIGQKPDNITGKAQIINVFL